MRDQSPTFTESVSEFYDDTPAELWKKVIGDDLHYHLGWGDGDIFYNSIKYLYQFILILLSQQLFFPRLFF